MTREEKARRMFEIEAEGKAILRKIKRIRKYPKSDREIIRKRRYLKIAVLWSMGYELFIESQRLAATPCFPMGGYLSKGEGGYLSKGEEVIYHEADAKYITIPKPTNK